MHDVRFTEAHHEGQTLWLRGPRFQGKIECREPGVWRIYLWHRLEDATKSSWILSPTELRPFEVIQEEGSCLLVASAMPELRVRLDPFRWKGLGLESLTLEAHRLQAFPLRQQKPTSWNEVEAHQETNDGLPLGAGFTLALKEHEERHYYGLGERTGFLDKKGRVWQNWASDTHSHQPDTDPLYQAHPFVLALQAGQASGLYLDETWRTVFDLAASDPQRSFIHSDGPTFDLYLIPGPSLKEVVTRFTAMSGRAPLPPLWALGFHQCRWSYPNEASIRAIAQEYRRRELPLDALWWDIDFMESYKVFTFSPARFPKPRELVQELREQGIRTVVIVDPGVKKESGYPVYDQGHAQDYFVKNHRDEEFTGEVWPGWCAWPDFIQEPVRRWWGDWHQIYLEAGIAGIWNDMNEPSVFHTPNKSMPPEAKHGAFWHAEVHNLYGLLMGKSTYEALTRLAPERRPFILTRSGFSGIQRYAWVWTGDNHSYWEHLELSLPMMLNLGLSGVPFTGADIGGFSAHSNGELLTRWMWLGAFYPFMRNHAGKGSLRQEPWAFGEPYTSAIGEALRWRYQLLPYLYTLAWEAHSTGWPLLRPLVLEYPEDPEVWHLHDQACLGADLLIAPALRPGQRQRLVYLPAGQWQDFWTGDLYEGQEWGAVATPLNQIGLFQRAGSAIPLTVPALQTTHAFWEKLIWRVSLAPQIRGQVYEDAGEGPAHGEFRTLEGSYTGKQLILSQQGPRASLPAQVRIQGVAKPRQASVPYHFQEGNLTFELSDQPLEVHW